MKKFNKKIFLLLSFMLILPFTILLTGCGATPARNVQSLKFVSDLYDQKTGYAIFEVDLNVETFLDYKITPSSGIASPTFSIFVYNNNPDTTDENSEINRTRAVMYNGKFTVIDEKFEEMVIKIELGELEDYCIVRLKKYPDKIFIDRACTLTESSDYINAYGEYTLHIFGNYSSDPENPDIRELKDTDFDFLVESNDITVINVLNSSRLKVCSIKNKIETATVTIYLLDTSGNKIENPYLSPDATEEEKLDKKYVRVKLKLTVILPPAMAKIEIEGHSEFIEPDETITLKVEENDFETELSPSGEWSYYLVDYHVELFTENGIYITNKMFTTTVTTNNDKFVRVDNASQKLKFRRPTTGTSYGEPVKITITSSANTALGESYSISFYIDFIFPESV